MVGIPAHKWREPSLKVRGYGGHSRLGDRARLFGRGHAISDDRNYLEEIILQVSRGDRFALGEIYDSTAPQVLGLLRSRLADARIANQLTQDVFVEVWRSAKRFDPARHHVVTWILSIAVDLLNRHLQPSSPTGVVALARPSAQRATERALLSMPATQQRALVLTRLHGLTPAQAADRMGLSTLDVETRIRAGLDLITAQLAVAS